MKLRNLLAFCVLAFAPACSKSTDSQVEEMVTLSEELGTAVEGSGGDCGKMADSVEAVMKKHDIPALKAAAEKLKGDKDKAKEMMEKYSDRMQAAMPKLMGMMKCASDPKMKELNGKLRGMM